jgi:hypothetical protein
MWRSRQSGSLLREDEHMNAEEIERAAAGLEDILASIRAGTLEATTANRSYLLGAYHALRSVQGEMEAPYEWMTTSSSTD